MRRPGSDGINLEASMRSIGETENICYSAATNKVSARLMNVYVSEAETLTRLTDTVLSHHGKNPHYYSVVVKEDDVKVLLTSSVPESERFPKVGIQTFLTETNIHCPAD